MKSRCWRTFALLSILLSLSSVGAGGEELGSANEQQEGEWLVIGNFKGATGTGLLSRLNNWLFEYERDDDLFRDLGDLGFGLGFDIDDNLRIDWDNYFRRRVVLSHRKIPAGEEVGEDDLSHYTKLDANRARLRVSWSYLPEVVGDFDIGIDVEGGYSVALARSQERRVFSDFPAESAILDTVGGELAEFFDENDVDGSRGLAYLTLASAAGVVDALGASLGNQFADTEKAAIYWDDYAAPIMAFTRTGLPLRLRIFLSRDDTLAVGDSLSFTTFAGISPLFARLDEKGLVIGYRRFFRLLRETTVRKEPNDVVLVRVRNWSSRGNELTPLKIRPEIRFLSIIKIGYTFFEQVNDRFGESVADAVYRVDLKTQEGMEFLQQLINQSNNLPIRPKIHSAEEKEGLEVLAQEATRGKSLVRRLRAQFFSWFRYRKTKIGATDRIEAEDAEFREVVRAITREYKKTIGRNRDIKSKYVITAHSKVDWQDGLGEGVEEADDGMAVTFGINITDEFAHERDVRSWLSNIDRVVALSQPDPELRELESVEIDGTVRYSANAVFSFGAEQIERVGAATEDDIWLELDDLLLGPEHGDAWSTAEKRSWWKSGAPKNSQLTPNAGPISAYFDELRGYQKPAKRSKGFNPDEYSSKRLFKIASKAVKSIQYVQRALVESPECLKCVLKGYSARKDMLLVQGLMVRLAGGVETGGVGYDVKVLVGEMTAPVGISNGILYGYNRPRPGDILQNAETVQDAEPRLRAGQMLLNVSKDESSERSSNAPCWKLRLYSDLRFGEGMKLRVHARKARQGADLTTGIAIIDLDEAGLVEEELGDLGYVRIKTDSRFSREFAIREDITQTTRGDSIIELESTFEQARFFYEVPIPFPGGLSSKEKRNFLLRVLNSSGQPVSEEQEVLVRLPKDWQQQVPRHCLSVVSEEADP